MAEKMRWGIIGCGRIAAQHAEALAISKTSELVAVAARDAARAKEFGAHWGAKRCYGSYEELVNDRNVDAVVVATIHPTHKETTILALSAGKPVLCEKPMSLNAAQTRAMIDAARANRRFLMEAMWTRFVPNIVRLREMIAEGLVGDVRMLQADFGFRGGNDPSNRQLNPELGGGALLDVGIYPLSLASMLLGKPVQVTGAADVGATGVDEQFAASLVYQGGRMAVLSGAIRTTTNRQAWILGTEGTIFLEPGWWGGSKLTLYRPWHKEEFDFPFESNRYVYQIEESARCIAAGKTESDVMPLDESLELARTMDTLRGLWGVKYAADEA